MTFSPLTVRPSCQLPGTFSVHILPAWRTVCMASQCRTAWAFSQVPPGLSQPSEEETQGPLGQPPEPTHQDQSRPGREDSALSIWGGTLCLHHIIIWPHLPVSFQDHVYSWSWAQIPQFRAWKALRNQGPAVIDQMERLRLMEGKGLSESSLLRELLFGRVQSQAGIPETRGEHGPRWGEWARLCDGGSGVRQTGPQLSHLFALRPGNAPTVCQARGVSEPPACRGAWLHEGLGLLPGAW